MDLDGKTAAGPMSGPAAERERLPWSGAEKLALVLLITGALVLLLFLVHPWYDAKNDSSMYIVAARALAAGEGYNYLEQPFHLRPPGFSVLISPIVGTLGANFRALNLYVSLWGVGGIILLFVYLRTRLGWQLSLLSSLVVWLNPAYQRFCNQVMADVPGTTLFFGCLLLERWTARTPSWKRDLVLGVSIGISAYVRTVNILLVPAIVVAWVLERWIRSDRSRSWPSLAGRLALVVAGACIVMLPWSVRNHYRAPPPPADQTSLYNYSTAVFHQDKGDPASPRVPLNELLQRIPERGVDIASSIARRMQSHGGGAHPAFALLVAVCWLWVLIKRRAPSDFFVAGALCVLVLYPGFQNRLILPAYMLLVGSVTETLRDLLRSVAGARVTPALVAATLLLLIVVDLRPRDKWGPIEKEYRVFEKSCSIIESNVSPATRLGSGTGWHYNVCLGRSVYGLKHAVFRARTNDVAEQVIDKYRIETVVLSSRDPVDRSLLLYFQSRYTEVEKVGEMIFVNVRGARD